MHVANGPVGIVRERMVVLTTSDTEEGVLRAYDLGVNTFLTKPSTYEGLIELVSTLKRYWLEMARLP